MSKTATETRKLERELQIEAEPERVWKALTDPDELARWFPLSANVSPGVGGEIVLAWGETFRGHNAIRVWEPAKHLRMGWFEAPEGDAAQTAERSPLQSDVEARKRLAVDYFLEAREGGTYLRLVHSGFSRSADWDDEFDGTRRGWIFELESLRTYLEHHAGRPRHLAWVRKPIDSAGADAWKVLTSPKGMLAEGSFDGLAAGERFAFTTVHGDTLRGTALNVQPPIEFSARLDEGPSLFRCGIETCFGRPEATVWLSTWGDPARAASFQQRWVRTLADLFAG